MIGRSGSRILYLRNIFEKFIKVELLVHIHSLVKEGRRIG